MSRFFEAWPKIPRLASKCSITEKIDGTNASIFVASEAELEDDESREAARQDLHFGRAALIGDNMVWAFSRKRLIHPGSDNFGFGVWVHYNARAIVEIVGPGRHFGEWWGSGIQRQYGLKEKRFSLFNAYRWSWLNNPEVRNEPEAEITIPLYCVPELYRGPFGANPLLDAISQLDYNGSQAAPGYEQPEGFVVHFRDNDAPFKYVLNAGKGGKAEDNPIF